MNNFFAELKRRNVVRVAIAYLVVAWVILQFVDIIQEPLNLPDWFQTVTIVFLGIGLPIALLLSWAFEVTPEGVMKTEEVDKSKSITHGTGKLINKLIIGGLALAVAFLLYDRLTLTQPEPSIAIEVAESGTSIAVLPFLNLSSDPEQEFFSDGISEEILNVLVRVEGLSVTSRTSAFAYKGQDRNIGDIAKELNVDHVLEGSVRRSDNTIRITAQLIDGKTDRHLWSETYDREFSEIFKIQDEISNAIVTALKETLGIEMMAPVTVDAVTENLTAYELYLKGRELFISRADLPQSADLLEQAVALDENFAKAWETLAAAYSVMPSWGFTDRPYKELSIQAADTAIALDSTLSLAYAVKGFNLSVDALIANQTPDWEGSLTMLNKAIENDSKNATAYLWRGIVYLYLGFFEKGIEDIRACLKIDPLYGNCKRHLANAFAGNGQSELALAFYQEGLEEGFGIFTGPVSPPNAMVAEGNDLAAILYWKAAPGFENFPAFAWVEAIKNPDGDHQAGWVKLQKWADEQDFDLETGLPSLLFVFGQYDLIGSSPDYSQWIWWDIAHDFRQTDHFKRIVNARNYMPYWQKFGFPPQCRAVGEEDFICE